MSRKPLPTKNRRLRAKFGDQQFGQMLYRRLKLAMITVALVWLMLAGRTFFIQVVWADRLEAKADRQKKEIVAIPAPRGAIYDRHGAPLTINWHNESFFAYPGSNNIDQLTKRLSALLSQPEARTRRNLYKKWEKFDWLVRQADDRTAAQIREWNIAGVYSIPEMTRAYTNGSAGRTVVGFVNIDNHGLAGVEYSCEEWLSGKDGKAVMWRDGLGRKYSMDPMRVAEPTPGCRVELTLDIDWQMILEDELAQGINNHGAQSGMAVLLDCRTGEILAMADAFAETNQPSGKATKCRVMTDVFEPGSSFKLVTFAAALSEGGMCPRDSFDAEMGKARFSNRYIRDDKKYGQLKLVDAFRLSSNIVTGKIANVLGGDVVHQWALRLGFGSRTGVRLPAEQRGSVPNHRWSEYVTAAFSIGHGVSVTTLQLANAYASLANGGRLMSPYLVRKVTDANGKIIYRRDPRVLRRVLAPEVAAQLLTMARAVVTDGTASQIYDPGFLLAGKTGTAEKPDLETKRMIKNKYIASFAGLWPADNPRLVGVVVLDEPEPIHYGGWTAAPILLNIFRRGSCAKEQHPGRRPAIRAPGIMVAGAIDHSSKQNVVSLEEDAADNQTPFWQRRRAQWAIPDDDRVGTVPKVIGMSAREAITVLQSRGLDAMINGTGRVVRQIPRPGSKTQQEKVCQLSLR